MNTDSLISVIVPIYNREAFLDRCIRSVLDQERVRTEIVLIDDGSTDSSGAICDRYVAENDNVLVVHNTNHGVSFARNCGLDNASGEYIYFLDSDDYIETDALFTLYTALTENGADMCIGNIEGVDRDGNVLENYPIPKEYTNKVIDSHKAYQMAVDVPGPLPNTITNRLYRKEIWNNLRFPVGKQNEDSFLIPDILERCRAIFVIDRVVYHYSITNNSIMRAKPTLKNLDSTEATLCETKYLIDKGYYDIALFRFGQGTRNLMSFKKVLSGPDAKKKIKEQYKGYCLCTRKLASHVDTKTKARFVLFCASLSLYGVIRKIARRNYSA